jgi:dolichyl-phosphate-mannose-protein mannosyltransferase
MNSLSIVDWCKDTVESIKRDARESWQAQSTVERITTVLLATMIIGGVILRVQGVASPPSFTFDEEPFVRNAHNYALGLADTNDHPPFGKLLIAVGMTLFGFNSLGWRFLPLCFGVQTVVLAYWLGRTVFADRRAGWMAAAFVAADGFFIAYSRSGLLDGMMVSLALWGVLAAVVAQSWRGVLASAVLIGLSMSIKWSGAFAAIPAGVALLMHRRVSIGTILVLGAAPLVHFLVWMGALRLTGQKSDPLATWNVMVGLYRHHLDLGHYKNDLSSSWWGWPILWKPVVVKLSDVGLEKRYSSSVGNLVFWSSVTLSMLALPISAAYFALRTRLKKYWLDFFGRPLTRSALLMVLGWFSFIAPWIATSSTRGKYTFSHYYLPCYAFGLVMLAGFAAYLERKRPAWVVDFVGIALLVSIYYAPVWGEFAMTTAAANHRLFIVSWRP